MNIFTLQLEALAGEDLKDATKEAIRISRLLGVAIQFSFNGVDIYISQTSQISKVVNEYHNAIKEGGTFIVC